MLVSGMVPMPVKCWMRHFRNWKVNDSDRHVKPEFRRAHTHRCDVIVVTVLQHQPGCRVPSSDVVTTPPPHQYLFLEAIMKRLSLTAPHKSLLSTLLKLHKH